MKIVQIGTGVLSMPPRGYGGIEKYIYSLAKNMAAAGHEITILDIQDEDNQSSAEADAISIGRLPTGAHQRPISILTLGFIFSKVRLLNFALKASRYLKANNFDVIHLNVALIGLVLAFSNRGQRPRMVYTVHSPVWAMTKPGALDRLNIQADCCLLRRVSKVIAQTDDIKEAIVARAGIPADKVYVSSGVDSSCAALVSGMTPSSCKTIHRQERHTVCRRISPYKASYIGESGDIIASSGYHDAFSCCVTDGSTA